MKTNVAALVETYVVGTITHPKLTSGSYRVRHNGTVGIPIGSNGNTHNVRVGDSCYGYANADHLEPGVSIKRLDKDENEALNTYACAGNEAVVLSSHWPEPGKSVAGKKGTVTGQHGGAERVLVDFPDDVLPYLVPGDEILVKAQGYGLCFPDYPQVTALSLSPRLLNAWGIREAKGRLEVPVAKVAPIGLAGSGLGAGNHYRGDIDVQTSTPDQRAHYALNELRLGDFFCYDDARADFGLHIHPGCVAIGVIIHGESDISGHGPGVMMLLTGPREQIVPVLKPGANLADVLKLRQGKGGARAKKRARS